VAPQDHTLCDYEVIDDDKNNPLISRNITTTTYDNIIHYGSLPSDGNMTDYSRAGNITQSINNKLYHICVLHYSNVILPV
jgi:hypothetical protein